METMVAHQLEFREISVRARKRVILTRHVAVRFLPADHIASVAQQALLIQAVLPAAFAGH